MPANSMQLKQINIELVRSVLKKEEHSTKTSIAKSTGLSVATCGNLLKELLSTGEVLEIDFNPSTGGRPARRFVYNENYAYAAIIFARKEGEYNTVTSVVTNMKGDRVYELDTDHDNITVATLEDAFVKLLEKYPKINVLGIGVPGVVREGVVDICDFKALSHQPIEKYFSKKYNIKVVVENDVNSTALGFYHQSHCKKNDNLVYIYYPIDENPGAGIIINGQILTGCSNFAGEVSFLPLGVSREKQCDIQEDSALFSELVAKTIASINCIINPDSIILSGFCFSDSVIGLIKKTFHDLTPNGHLPELHYDEDIYDSYIYGLTSMALEKLSCNIQIIEK